MSDGDSLRSQREALCISRRFAQRLANKIFNSFEHARELVQTVPVDEQLATPTMLAPGG